MALPAFFMRGVCMDSRRNMWVQDSEGNMVVQRDDGVTDIGSYVGADGEIYHVQNVGRILAHCAEMRKEGKGWSDMRTMKRAASIPLVEFLKHPALAELDTNEAVEDYVRKYLPQYATSHETGGIACPQIVVK